MPDLESTLVDASETSAYGLTPRSGTRIIIEDVNADRAFEPHRGIAAATGFRGVQSTPLFDRSSGKLLGMLSTHFREPHLPSEHELRMTDVYGLQAAVDLVRLCLYAWNPQTNELQWDDTLRTMWGLPPAGRLNC